MTEQLKKKKKKYQFPFQGKGGVAHC